MGFFVFGLFSGGYKVVAVPLGISHEGHMGIWAYAMYGHMGMRWEKATGSLVGKITLTHLTKKGKNSD